MSNIVAINSYIKLGLFEVFVYYGHLKIGGGVYFYIYKYKNSVSFGSSALVHTHSERIILVGLIQFRLK